jgi:predicted DNA-binding transcriptional regulator YafY
VGRPGSFETPPGFDAATALPDDPKLIGGEEAVEAEVVVDAIQAAKVEDEQGPASVAERRDDGSIVVRMQVTNRDAFRSWLLGLRDHAEVTGPSELRDDVVAWLTAVAASA